MSASLSLSFFFSFSLFLSFSPSLSFFLFLLLSLSFFVAFSPFRSFSPSRVRKVVAGMLMKRNRFQFFGIHNDPTNGMNLDIPMV